MPTPTINTPRTDSAPTAWDTPQFHADSAFVVQQLHESVTTGNIDGFLAFLAGPSGNRVLTYNRECNEGVKQFICGLQHNDLSVTARDYLNQICINQGWDPT